MKQHGARFDKIAIDVATTSNNNKYILVVMDYFREWAEAYAIPNQEDSTVRLSCLWASLSKNPNIIFRKQNKFTPKLIIQSKNAGLSI